VPALDNYFEKASRRKPPEPGQIPLLAPRRPRSCVGRCWRAPGRPGWAPAPPSRLARSWWPPAELGDWKRPWRGLCQASWPESAPRSGTGSPGAVSRAGSGNSSRSRQAPGPCRRADGIPRRTLLSRHPSQKPTPELQISRRSSAGAAGSLSGSYGEAPAGHPRNRTAAGGRDRGCSRPAEPTKAPRKPPPGGQEPSASAPTGRAAIQVPPTSSRNWNCWCRSRPGGRSAPIPAAWGWRPAG
jgi:hypothetical protein